MESLLDAADALVTATQSALDGLQPPCPDLAIPDELLNISTDTFLHLRDTDTQGRGWFATRDIPAGTLLMVSKPIAMVMDWQDDSADKEEDDMIDDEDDAEEREPRLNEILLLEILKLLKQQPRLWNDKLSTMFPRENTNLPAWVCQDDDVFFQIESHLQELRQISFLKDHVSKIGKLLPLIIRYNILSVETCPEMLSYPGMNGHSSLSGVGLYHLPSFFNHSPSPNCSRWAVGDVTGFVANQDIPAGEQVCISYIEHDVLCESPFRRNKMLIMDFQDCREQEVSIASEEEEDGPAFPVVDADVQNELMFMNPLERLSAIDELLQQATGEKLPEDELIEENAMHATSSSWFKCDVQNLRIIKAITLDAIGQSKEALLLWEESISFADRYLPPLDESSIMVRVHAALCSYHVGNVECAKRHAKRALNDHDLLFGGGSRLLIRRYRNDLQLKIRPGDNKMKATVEELWPTEH